jgi:hypothetical protein
VISKGTSVSHVADIVGPEGTVYAVEFSHRSGRDLINMATHRTNVIPIVSTFFPEIALQGKETNSPQRTLVVPLNIECSWVWLIAYSQTSHSRIKHAL